MALNIHLNRDKLALIRKADDFDRQTNERTNERPASGHKLFHRHFYGPVSEQSGEYNKTQDTTTATLGEKKLRIEVVEG